MSDDSHRVNEEPYTAAWYAQQFRGLNHHWQRCLVEEADLAQQVRLYRKEIDQLRKDRESDKAMLGSVIATNDLLRDAMERQQEKIAALSKRLDDAANVVAEMRRPKNGAVKHE
jgi:predicted  nucleic acid-binding Zn-ribbon protein